MSSLPSSPASTTPEGLVVGAIELLPAYPTQVPQSVSNVVGVFPSTMRYAGQLDVEGQSSAAISIIRFGEGHPAFSPTILVGSPLQEVDVVLGNSTPIPHNFSTVDGKIDLEVPTGESVHATVTFPQSGYLFFFCKYHLQDSQIGALLARP